MYQYPYGNAQQLNLDWILSKLQELESGSGEGADLEEVANALVSASFDATIPYRKYDYAFYDGKLYRALNDTIGAFNPADWMEVTLGADIPVLTRLVNADSALITTLQNQLQNLGSDEVANESTVTGTTVTAALDNLNGAISDEATARVNADNALQGQISAYIQTSTTASRAYAKGDYFVLNGVLYRVTTAIDNGGTITIGTNAIATNVGAELNTTIKTLGFLKAGLSITGASTIGSFTLPAGEWLFLERVYASTAGEVALTVNGNVSLHTNALSGSYVYGFNLATTNANTTFTYGTNSWNTAKIGQLYVEVIPLLETRTSFS